MADPRKYNLSRRVMPGQRGIVDQNTRQVEKRLFDLVRGQEFTANVHWYLSDTPLGKVGDIGARLDKTSTSSTAPLGLDFLIDGSPIWGLNVNLAKDFTISDQAGSKGACFSINASGKVTVAHDFSHAGSTLGFFGTAAAAQPAGSSDILAGLVTLGLRGASSNPPFNIGTGQITCGKVVASDTSTFSTSSNAQVLVLNAGTSVAATIKMNPSPGTKRNTVQMGGIFQWGTDINFNGGSDFWFQSLLTGNNFLLCDSSDKLTLGTTNASGGVVAGVSGGKLSFYGGSPAAKPTVSGEAVGNRALKSLLSALGTQGLITNSTLTSDPTAQTFTWVNQGGATVTNANNASLLSAPASSGDNLRCQVKSAPTAPYTLTIGFLPLGVNQNFILCGLCLRNSTSGSIITLAWTNNASLLANSPCVTVTKWTNATTFSANYTTSPSLIPAVNWQAGACLWFQVNDDGTNRSYRISNDGVNFQTVLTTVDTDFITPDQIGWFVDVNNATFSAGMNLLSWLQT